MTLETGSDGLLTRVVRAIADHRGVEPTALETPLAAAVDTDALGQLFADRPDGRPRGQGLITFDYEDLSVTVDSDADVRVATRPDAGLSRATAEE